MTILNERCFLAEDIIYQLKQLYSNSESIATRKKIKKIISESGKKTLSSFGFKVGSCSFVKQEFLPISIRNLILGKQIQCIDFSGMVSYFDFKDSTGIVLKNAFDFFEYGDVYRKDGSLVHPSDEISPSKIFVSIPEEFSKTIKNNALIYYIGVEEEGKKKRGKYINKIHLFDKMISIVHKDKNIKYHFGVIV